jgi:hypothetical protein
MNHLRVDQAVVLVMSREEVVGKVGGEQLDCGERVLGLLSDPTKMRMMTNETMPVDETAVRISTAPFRLYPALISTRKRKSQRSISLNSWLHNHEFLLCLQYLLVCTVLLFPVHNELHHPVSRVSPRQSSPRSDFSPVFSPAAAATSRSVGGRSPKPVAGTFQAFPSPRAATFVTADGVERPTTADDEQWRQVEIRRRIQEKGYVLGGYGESNRSKELLSPALQSRDRAGSAGRKLEKETIMKQRAKSNDDRPQKLEKTVKRSRLSRIFGSGDKTTTSTLTSVTGRAVAAN